MSIVYDVPLADNNPKTRMGAMKPSLRAIPPVALFHLGGAMEDGAVKYGPFNWREEKITASTYYNAMMRHITAWWDGEDLAPDSQRHHLAHVMACAALLLDAESLGDLLVDDRPAVPGMTAQFIADNTGKDKSNGSTTEPDDFHATRIERHPKTGGRRARDILREYEDRQRGHEVLRGIPTQPPWLDPNPTGTGAGKPEPGEGTAGG